MQRYLTLLPMPIHLSPEGLSVLGIYPVNYQPFVYTHREAGSLPWVSCMPEQRSSVASIWYYCISTACNGISRHVLLHRRYCGEGRQCFM